MIAINFYPSDAIVHRHPVLELELPVQVDFDDRAAMRFLGLVKLIPAVAAGVQSVVKLIESLAENRRGPFTCSIQFKDPRNNCF